MCDVCAWYVIFPTPMTEGFWNESKTVYHCGEKQTAIDSEMFKGTNIREVHVTAGIRAIGNGAFSGCRALETVTFEKESKLCSLGEDAFRGCEKLRHIALPTGLAKIKRYCFWESGIEEVELPSSVQSVGANAFPTGAVVSRPDSYRPEGVLTANVVRKILATLRRKDVFYVPSWVKTIDILCFWGTGVREVHVPESVEVIDCCAFNNCALRRIFFAPNSRLRMIKKAAFNGCKNLDGVVIPANVEAIESGAFQYCRSL